jgi:hypothetical protein
MFVDYLLALLPLFVAAIFLVVAVAASDSSWKLHSIVISAIAEVTIETVALAVSFSLAASDGHALAAVSILAALATIPTVVGTIVYEFFG